MSVRTVCALGAIVPAFVALVACNGPDVQHIQVDGLDREYVVHVPPQVSPDVKPAMVVMLHGTSGDGAKFYNTSHWVQTADEVATRWKSCNADGDCPKKLRNEKGGVITVFPSSLSYCIADELHPGGKEWVVTTKWNSGSIGTDELPFCPSNVIGNLPLRQRLQIQTLKRQGNQFSQTMADDVKFIRILVDRLASQYNVDRDRIYVAGFSNGGQFSTRLGLEMSDVFAAVATAAGPPDTLGVAPNAIPIFAEVGTKDQLFLAFRNPDNPGLIVDELPFSERALEVTVFAGYAERLAQQAGVDPTVYTTSKETLNGVQTLKFSFDKPTRGVENHVELLLTKGVSHQFPQGETNPLVLANVMWDFFREYQQKDDVRTGGTTGRATKSRGQGDDGEGKAGKARDRDDGGDDPEGKGGKGKGGKGGKGR